MLHLDNTKFYGDWQEADHATQNATVECFLRESESRGIDGNHSSIAPRRFAESDLTVFLDFNRVLCFFSVWRRYLQYCGRARESCPCAEKFDRAFRRRLLFDGRTREKAEKLRRLLAGTAGAQVVLKNRRQVRKFLEKQKAAVGGREV